MLYLAGDSTAIEGTGQTFIVGDAVLVQLLDLPAGLGHDAADVPRYYELGHLTWLADVGAIATVEIEYLEQFVPAPAAVPRGVGWWLRAGVAGVLTVYYGVPGDYLDAGRLAPDVVAAGTQAWITLG